MKRMILMIILFIGIIINISAEDGVVKRDRATVRSGPGSIFEIISEMTKGDSFLIVDEQKGWLNIEYNELNGFTSSKVVIEKQGSDDIFSKMGVQETDLKVSKHGMSAGVKGFADKYTDKFEGSSNFLEDYYALELNADKFKYFKQVTYHEYDLDKIKDYELPEYDGKEFYSFNEEGIGFGIAARIAEIGLLKNEELCEYINFLGHILVEASDAYDIGFKFFILDTELVNAYACPGGIVFITRGMLEILVDEAELAGVLAHEIAHIARHHGMQEIEERKHHVSSDDAFAEMDAELEEINEGYDEDIKAIESELEDIALESYEAIFNGRLADYEEEADYLAMIYSLRAGYDYSRLFDLLRRMYAFETESTNEHYSSEQIKDRITALEKNIKQIKISHKIDLMNKQYRWENMKEKLN
ncbi:M48 family metalloprotease [Candidatus Cloacimonadota bacterium]